MAGASGGVVGVGGAAIIVVANWWVDGSVFALASGGVVGVGSATIVVVTRWWRNGNVHTSTGIGV